MMFGLWKKYINNIIKTTVLEIIDKQINWEPLIDLCKNLYLHNTKKGERKPVPIIFKLKLLFLQHLYNTSYEYLEEQVIDNLSFQKFMG